MNKKLVLVGTFLILIAVGLSGCNEIRSGSGLEVIGYTVVTTWLTGSMWDGTQQRHYESGFYHDIPDDAYDGMYKAHYKINGTVKNNAGRKIDLFYVIIRFYDADGNDLIARQKILMNLPNNYTEDFSFEYPDAWGGGYFDSIDHVTFEISEEPKEGIIMAY